jgi:hypothetical protein
MLTLKTQPFAQSRPVAIRKTTSYIIGIRQSASDTYSSIYPPRHALTDAALRIYPDKEVRTYCEPD